MRTQPLATCVEEVRIELKPFPTARLSREAPSPSGLIFHAPHLGIEPLSPGEYRRINPKMLGCVRGQGEFRNPDFLRVEQVLCL